MLNDKILSVVVPSYNAEKFLKETIPTMVEVKEPELLEVIIVNDGSKDNTLEVAKELQENYTGVVKIIDKENGGHGSTINAGIKLARGKYFKVIDADDWAETNNLSDLIDYLKLCDDDQVISPYIEVYVNDNKEVLQEYIIQKHRGTMGYPEFISVIGKIPVMHSITIKTEILRDNNIELDENCFYVDLEYNVFPIPYLKTVSYFEKPIYRYRLGRQGQSVSMESYIRNVAMHERVIFALIDFYNKNRKNINQKVEYSVIDLIATAISTHTAIYLSMPYSKEVKQEYVNFEKKLRARNSKIASISKGVRQKILRLTNYMAFKFLRKKGSM